MEVIHVQERGREHKRTQQYVCCYFCSHKASSLWQLRCTEGDIVWHHTVVPYCSTTILR